MIHIFSVVFVCFFLLLLLFIHFPSLLFINYRYFNEKCPMIGRKISKGDMICHNKPHFCFVRVNIIKMVKQSGICPFEAKSNICSLTNFFFHRNDYKYNSYKMHTSVSKFDKKSFTLKLWYWGMHFIGIIFIVVSMICWLTSYMVQAVQNPCKMLMTLNVDNNILVNMSHHIMISAG